MAHKTLTIPQLLANRKNALRSTGPKTPAGKARSAANLTQALAARQSRTEFDRLYLERALNEECLRRYQAAQDNFLSALTPNRTQNQLSAAMIIAVGDKKYRAVENLIEQCHLRRSQITRELRKLIRKRS